MLDLVMLELTEKPNQYLVAPANYCQKASPHREAPTYDVPATVLRDAWLKVVEKQPRTTQTAGDDSALQYDFVQRSAIMRYPDTVTVRFLPLEDSRSTLAIYSRSKYGYSDLGVNKKRIDNWLDALEAEVK